MYGVQAVQLGAPITHSPTYLGNESYILGGKNLFQNGTAYSYVWINATALKAGDSFAGYPALNLGFKGNGINENNLTAIITYTGSTFGSSPYWINFSVQIPILHLWVNSSQIGFADNFSRSSEAIKGMGYAEFFTQMSIVVNSNNEFEYFFYIGNSTTPTPKLAHGPVN